MSNQEVTARLPGMDSPLQNLLKNSAFHYLIMFLVTFWAYHNMMSHYFLSDDFNLLLGSSNWLSPGEGYFRPVPHLVVHLFYQLFSLEVAPYHLLSLLLHFLNALLLYNLVKKTVRNPFMALAAGSLFSVNFLISESVYWISSVTTLAVTFFYLLGTLLYVKFLENRKKNFYLLVFLCFFLGLLSKENAVTFSAILLIFDLKHNYEQDKKLHLAGAFKRILPFLLLTSLYLVFKAAAISSAMTSDTLSLGYHNLRNTRHLLLSLCTFNPFHDLPFLYIDISILNLFLKQNIPNLQIAFNLKQFFLPLLLGTTIQVYCLYLLFKGSPKMKAALWAFFFSLGPFVFISSHHKTFAGYYLFPLRLYYLPAAFFFFAAAILIAGAYSRLKERINPRAATALVALVLVLLTFTETLKVNKRGQDWATAGNISRSLLHNLEGILAEDTQATQLVIFNLPDNYRGAYIFRNGFSSALKLLYPQIEAEIIISRKSPAEYRPGEGEVEPVLIDCNEGKATRVFPSEIVK